MQTRADRINPKILRLLKMAGCVCIELGIETANQNQLNQIGKAVSVNTFERAIRWCQKSGITTRAYLMTGFPGETLDNMKTTLNWLKMVKPDIFSWCLLSLHPGTTLYEKTGHNFFADHDWQEASIADFFQRDHTSSIHPEERKRWQNNQLFPYQKRLRHNHILKVNNLCQLGSLAGNILMDRIKNIIVKKLF